MINYYFNNQFDKENKYRPYTYSLVANDYTLPPDNALRIAPEFKDGYIPCEYNGKWVLVEDNRNKTAYNVETQESVKIDYLGKIKDGFTLLEPFEFCKWNGEKWVKDKDAENEATIAQAQAIKNSLISEANNKIAVLQDTIDLGIQKDDEETQLKQWKKYRILLTRIDTSNINVIFPEKP
ncbi:tail fiber assembly protein [Gilliamella sp. wkB112]|uniref:tail fiber assembly protein n=1 Tax=Gilliamella sp. wkB112 TaxID=3120257 RepID=UPI00080D9E25|nr:tail fiber assembly protein [Gilliamella apicola]OCG02903.1 hypothetical protein A9G12_08210 [Gilliamella apicola]